MAALIRDWDEDTRALQKRRGALVGLRVADRRRRRRRSPSPRGMRLIAPRAPRRERLRREGLGSVRRGGRAYGA
jgi:hypothetical protein